MRRVIGFAALIAALAAAAVWVVGASASGGTADLTIDHVSSPKKVTVGSTFNYVVFFGDNGPDTASNAQIVDPLPASMTLIGTSATRPVSCSESGGVLTCSLGDIAIHRQGSLTITVMANATGRFKNTATISSDSTDPNPANNTASRVVKVTP
jgi:uncharacterized repeat protein (TIGR01451 family)